MFLPFQRCIFADAHATRRRRRFAATGPVAAAARKTIRGPVLARDGRRRAVWKLFYLTIVFPSPRARDAWHYVSRLVRRHFYYSSGRRRFDAPRRLCKHNAAFAAFFSTYARKKKGGRFRYNNLRMRRASHSLVSDFGRVVFETRDFREIRFTQQIFSTRELPKYLFQSSCAIQYK